MSVSARLPAQPSLQVELLEKAKRKNIIVYLGTGSGKTFIAVMLIKHLGQRLGPAQKVIQVLPAVVLLQTVLQAIFLVNNVSLLEQQAEVCRQTTGLATRR